MAILKTVLLKIWATFYSNIWSLCEHFKRGNFVNTFFSKRARENAFQWNDHFWRIYFFIPDVSIQGKSEACFERTQEGEKWHVRRWQGESNPHFSLGGGHFIRFIKITRFEDDISLITGYGPSVGGQKQLRPWDKRSHVRLLERYEGSNCKWWASNRCSYSNLFFVNPFWISLPYDSPFIPYIGRGGAVCVVVRYDLRTICDEGSGYLPTVSWKRGRSP